jgi:spermidine synthase
MANGGTSMGLRFRGLERALLALFVVSGFAGLIYQAIWSHYLGLSLGHAAYAQTLVLAIFMGGMALGAWLVSRFGTGWRRLILAYAVIEVVIGVAGLGFHPLFMAYTGFSQGTVYPALSSEATVSAWQWGSAALLIAPQSILLGMTFPLMSGGYLRVAPGADGEILGGLYFSNSIGAAMGALAATFVLLPWVGMPGSVMIAGGLNILVGVLAWAVSRRADLAQVPVPAMLAPAPSATSAPEAAGFKQMMLVAAAITGASSFVYEIGWVRMLNQALGTTVHSFELMLAAFILGLAFGGLWIRSRSQRIADAVAYAGYAQLFMGIAALLSILVFSQSFRWVGAMVEALPKTEDGYALYSLGSGAIALLVMFPAAFFAGMTLPLFTMALLRRGAGEASIGQVYAANTLGAILGVVLAVHLLIPLLGLRLAVTLAALADIVLGVVLLRLHADAVGKRPYIAAVAACVVALGLSLVLGKPDPRALASGVFRHGQSELAEDTRIHYVRDGKTATIALYSQGSVATIATNGKPDASLELDPAAPPVADEVTMLMAAALPLAIHPEPRDVAIIGWGSGLTTHSVLGSATPRVVDSIEIERAMYDGARLYADRVERAYHDPRSRLHIDDARTYFSTGKKRYDVIISEPSNPWVSGVSSLFTQQFYSFLGNHLQDDGILVQWLQSYELSDPLLATMLAALHAEFPHIDVYLTNSADLLFVSSRSPLPALDAARVAEPALAAELARVGLAGEGDYAVRRIGSRDLVGALVTLSGVGPHSDFYPVVSLEAPKARFMGATARQMLTLMSLGMPVLEMTDGREPVPLDQSVQFADTSIGSEIHWVAGGIRVAMTSTNTSVLDTIDPIAAESVARLRAASVATPVDQAGWLEAVAEVADYSLGHLRAEDLEGLWINPTWIDSEAQPEIIRQVLAAYAAASRRDAAAMARDGRLALEALGQDAPGLVREQMLVIMLLGALREGGPDAMAAIEREYGARVPAASNYGLARAYLLAWGDSGQR